MTFDVAQAASEVLSHIDKDPHLRKFVDRTIPLPAIFKGPNVKLIIVGQDPTVRDPLRRKQITTTLDLSKRDGHLREYLKEICLGLQISLDDNVYATNFYKNFFVEPPAEINKINIFSEFSDYWLPLLKKEIEQFPSIPIITLGEPLLKPLVRLGQEYQVKHYWGYTPEWRDGGHPEFKHIKPEANHLGRVIFPFPHQPSATSDFYKHEMPDYIKYVRMTGISKA